MQTPLSSSAWAKLQEELEIEISKKSKARLLNLILEALDSCGSAESTNNNCPAQLCGIWLIGAVDMWLTGALDPDPVTSSKKSKSIGKTKEDDRFLTGLFRFVAKRRTETEMQNIFDYLDNTTRCYCSKGADEKTEVDDFPVFHFPHDLGQEMLDTFRDSGHFLPATCGRIRTKPPHFQAFPYLRGRKSRSFSQSHTPQYFYPIRRPQYAQIAECAITSLFESLTSILEGCTSASFSRGRANSWPYSPREFMLLVEQRTPSNTRSPTNSTDDTEACASTLMSAITQWTVWLPNSSPTYLLTRIVNMCGTLVVPSMVEYRYSLTTLPDLAKFIIDSSLSAFQEIDHTVPSLYHFDHRKEIGLYVMRQCQRVGRFFSLSVHGPGVPLQWNNTLVPDECLRMAQLFTMMMYLLEDSRIPLLVRDSDFGKSVRQSMRHLCFSYHSMARLVLNMPDNDLGMVCHPLLAQHYVEIQARKNSEHAFIIDPSSTVQSPEDIPSSSRQDFLDILPAVLKRTYCCTWGCSKSVQEAGKDFKACSGCGIVKYCGRNCQKLDWKGFYHSGEPLKDPELRHAYLCTLLKQFNTSSKDKSAFAEDVALDDQEWCRLSPC